MKDKLVFNLLKGLARLPLAVLYIFADFISFILYYIINYRKSVVKANLTTSFPEKSPQEINRIQKEFYRYLGDQVVETVKLLHISDKELEKRIKIIDTDIVNESLSKGKNAVVLMGHYGNWEWVQEITRELLPGSFMCSIYHPLKNKTWDEFFIQLRSRWHAHIVPMKKVTRILLNKENQPWVCGFIADARPDNRIEDNNTVEFLNHNTRFITGPEVIGDKVGADYFYLEMIRLRRGHYELKYFPINPEDSSLPYPHLREFWAKFEETIKKNPALWLWSHKRWK